MKELREGFGRTVEVGSGVVNASVIYLVAANGAKLQLFGSGVCASAAVAQGVEPQLALTAIGWWRNMVEVGFWGSEGAGKRQRVSRP